MNEDINYKYKGFINKVVKIINIEEISKIMMKLKILYQIIILFQPWKNILYSI